MKRNRKPHKNLEVWKLSVDFVKDIYTLTTNFPDEEKFGIISQLRRAVVSIPTNIAEGAARSTKKELRNFLYIASGSLSEIDTLLTISKELGFIKESQLDALNEKLVKIDIMLDGLIKKLKKDMAKIK